MGNVCECCTPAPDANGVNNYTRIEDTASDHTVKNELAMQTIFHTIPDDLESTREFDQNQPVFKGMVVQQKFHGKSTYDPRFAWINLKNRSLCLSEFNSTEHRHKEASIADIVGVVAGPPKKFKAMPQDVLDPNCCLSIMFVRGGGIDIRFTNREDRDMWSRVLMRLISHQQELDSTVGGVKSNQ